MNKSGVNSNFTKLARSILGSSPFIARIVLALLLLISIPIQQAIAAQAKYRAPSLDGYALDYCRNLGTNCGQPAADAFCQSKGYQGAVKNGFQIIENSPKTYIIGDETICDDPGCDRIVNLSCIADAAFKNPKVGNYPLDLCESWGQNCGKPAADAYCRSRGYEAAIGYRFRNDSPPTRIINGYRICDRPFCDRIVAVTCKGKWQGQADGKFDPGTEWMPEPPGANEFVDFDF